MASRAMSGPPIWGRRYSSIWAFRTKSLVFSGLLGAGVETSRLFVEVRYQRGLSSIDNSSDGLEIKNRVLALVAGYGFRVGR